LSLQVCKAPLPRDVDSLQHCVVTHKDFERQVQNHEPEISQVKNLFSNIPQKTPKEQAKLDKVLDQWDRIWSFSSYYVERLKTVEITLTGLEEVTIVVTEFEMKLAAYDSMPSDMDNLRKAHDDLMTLEAEIESKQVRNSCTIKCIGAKNSSFRSSRLNKIDARANCPWVVRWTDSIFPPLSALPCGHNTFFYKLKPSHI
jgi:hypothetical protein